MKIKPCLSVLLAVVLLLSPAMNLTAANLAAGIGTAGETLADGEYSIGTALRKYAEASLSMGNDAIEHSQSRLMIKNGVAEIRLVFKPLTQRLGQYDFVGYLLDLWRMDNIVSSGGVIESFTPVHATVYSEYIGETDDYGPPAGRWYPKELGMTVVIGQAFTPVQVFVPVMDAISAGSGTQPARLQLDWDSLTLIQADEPATEPPVTEAPATEPPVTEPPATEPPATEPPATEPPATEPPATEPPATEPSATEAPATEPSATEAPATETTTTETTTTETTTTAPAGSGGSGGGGESSTGGESDNASYEVDVALWHANLDQASMGNEAFTGNRGLLNVFNGGYKLQAATHPVNIRLTADQSFISALKGLQYFKNGSWTDVGVVSTGQVTTDPKQTTDGPHTFTYIKVFEIDLEDMTTSYVRVRVMVPYTPMGEDWIEARLKIDWPTLEKLETTDTDAGRLTLFPEEVPLSQTDYGEDFEKTDSLTGISVTALSGVTPVGTELKVNLITSGTDYTKAQIALEGVAEQFTLYDLTLISEEKEIQPDGRLTMNFPIPGGWDPSKIALYRINDDSTSTLIKGSISGNEYVVQVSRLSLYALAEGYETNALSLTAAAPATAAARGSAADKFTDIVGHWAYNDICYAVENGLFAGTGETTFSPDTPMTRGMLVTVLGRIAGIDAAAYKDSPFVDVAPEQYYAPYVAWTVKIGIISGVGDGKFAPGSQVTREQLAVILNNYAKFAKILLKTGTPPVFADDADIGPWAKEGVNAVTGAGILAGTGGGAFEPKGAATRAQVAAVLSRFIQTYVKKTE